MEQTNEQPTAKSLYDAKDYQGCIDACRIVWQTTPERRASIRHLYAWSIYRLIIKSNKTNAGSLCKAVAAIAQLCPETGERDPLTHAALTAASLHMSAASPRHEAAIQALGYLSNAALPDQPETRDGNFFASLKERYVMMLSKALDKSGRHEECVQMLEHLLTEDFQLTGNNRHHLRFRLADCLLHVGHTNTALEILIDLEPFIPQSYLVSRTGDAHLALNQFGLARACYAASLEMTRDLAFGLPAIKQLVLQAKSLDIDRRLAHLHGWLFNHIREEKGWRAEDFPALGGCAISQETPTVGPTIRELRAMWKQWAAMRYCHTTGVIRNILPSGQLAFIVEDQTRQTVVVRPQSCGGRLPPVGAKVAFAKRRSYDRKKDRLGWEAVGITLLP